MRTASGHYTLTWDKPEQAAALVALLMEPRPGGNAHDRRKWRRARAKRRKAAA